MNLSKRLSRIILACLISLLGLPKGGFAQIDSAGQRKALVQIGIDFSGGIFDYLPAKKSSFHYVYSTFTYSVGLSADFNIGKHLGVGVGLRYTNEPWKAEQNWTDSFVPYRTVHYSTQNHYWDIPLMLNVYSATKKVRFSGSAGLEANVHFHEYDKQIYYQDDGTVYLHREFPWSTDLTPKVSVVASAGVEMKIHPRIAFRFSPYFGIRVFEGAINRSSYAWSTGARLAVYYCVKPK